MPHKSSSLWGCSAHVFLFNRVRLRLERFYGNFYVICLEWGYFLAFLCFSFIRQFICFPFFRLKDFSSECVSFFFHLAKFCREIHEEKWEAHKPDMYFIFRHQKFSSPVLRHRSVFFSEFFGVYCYIYTLQGSYFSHREFKRLCRDPDNWCCRNSSRFLKTKQPNRFSTWNLAYFPIIVSDHFFQ